MLTSIFDIRTLPMRIIAVVLAMSVHEMAHALVSYWMGDPTAKLEGRLSLNPFKHIDWMGVLCLMFFGFGWAKPVPIDTRYYKDAKTGIIWTSFAGPFANFILAFVCVFISVALLKFMPVFALSSDIGLYITDTLQFTAMISLGFGVFNLIPIPPLDGSKVIFSFLPDEQYYKVVEGSQVFYFIFIALLLSGILDTPLMMCRNALFEMCLKVSFMVLGI